MNSNDLLYLISIDSLFNSLLFILIYNINLSKKDKIAYYQTFLLSIRVRYLYFCCLLIISQILSILFNRNIDISLLACPIFTYLFYKQSYVHNIINLIFNTINFHIQKVICYILYV